ncbi:hypothetical protein [Litorilituus lipolyticus]|uniref:Uncharacterized protein n=1 Tax=Litorilituus lipolyticus TaxID=2491017 RepID=A0A502KVT2_9GAMM|nr:hypothetical protein [Litorilituus lipolyticus]TPH15546.1 hypothetical protein EPA86_08170 [Litorilituus lipolyticus]
MNNNNEAQINHKSSELVQNEMELSHGQTFNELFHRKILFIIAIVALAFFLLFSQSLSQEKYVAELVDNHISPTKSLITQIQLVHHQQQGLSDIVAFNQLDDVVKEHGKLLENNTQLMSFTSEHQANYSRWQKSYQEGTRLLDRLQKVQQRNQQLKQDIIKSINALLLVKDPSYLLPASKQQRQVVAAFNQQLQLSLPTFIKLGFYSPLQEFINTRQALQQKIVEVMRIKFTEPYQEMLISFEQLLIGQGNSLAKWQGYLRLAQQYYQIINQQNSHVQQLITELMVTETPEVASTPSVMSLFERWMHQLFPQLNKSTFFNVLLLVTGGLFLLLMYFCYVLSDAIKVRMQQLIDYCQQVNNSHSVEIANDELTYEEEQLLSIVREGAEKGKHAVEYNELVKLHDKVIIQLAEQSTLVNELKASATLTEEKQQLLSQQQGYALQRKYQYLQKAIEHARGYFSVQVGQPHNYKLPALYQRIGLWQLTNNLKLEETTLALKDISILSEIYAVLLNYWPDLAENNHTLAVKVNENIAAEVKLDISLFAQLLHCFMQLISKDQMQNRIEILLQLKDKNFAQQRIQVTANIASKTKSTVLPQSLKALQGTDNLTEADMLPYAFNYLLDKMHGSDTTIMLTESGYQFSFAFPLAPVKESSRINKKTRAAKTATIEEKSIAQLFDGKSLTSLFLSKHTQPLHKRVVSVVEVLLASKNPQDYINLYAQLHWLGCHVHVVTQVEHLQQYWQSGCFSIVITEFDLAPLQSINKSLQTISATRALLSLSGNKVTQKNWPKEWLVETINRDISVETLSELLMPWFKREKVTKNSKKVANQNINERPTNKAKFAEKADSIKVADDCSSEHLKANVFDLNRYIHHQGSAELAFYMLDEYLGDNQRYFSTLSEAMAKQDMEQAQASVDELMVNAKILASLELQHLCEHWNQLIASDLKTVKPTLITKLLSKTKQAINSIMHSAQQLVVNT